MATVLTAQPAIYMTPNETRNIACSFKDKLTSDDLLTGTPTLSITSSGPTLSLPAVNGANIEMEIPGNEHTATPGQAVTFRAAASTTTASTYTATVRCSTTGGQVLEEFVTIIVSVS